MGICYLVGAMETRFPIRRKPGDLIIAADGGYRSLLTMGLKPDMVVGDFDSLGYVPQDVETIQVPARKNDTDMLLAAQEGIKRGFDRFMLVGGMGGRLDHTVGNFQVLAWLAKRGARGAMAGPRETAIILHNDKAEFHAGATGTISVFAWGGPAKGITLENLEYPLTDAELDCSSLLGISNSFTQAPARISVKDGMLLVLWSGGIDKMIRL